MLKDFPDEISGDINECEFNNVIFNMTLLNNAWVKDPFEVQDTVQYTNKF